MVLVEAGGGTKSPEQLGEGEAGPAGGLPTCQLRGWGRPGVRYPCPLATEKRNIMHITLGGSVLQASPCYYLDQRSLGTTPFLQISTSPVSLSFFSRL